MNIKAFLKNSRGVVAIKFALMLPIFMALVFAALEMGNYYMQQQIADRAILLLRDSIEYNAGNDTLLRDYAYNSGTTYMNLNPVSGAPNYICAQSYLTEAQARSNLCSDPKVWNTKPPAGFTGGSYYVGVEARAKKGWRLPFADFMPDILSRDVIEVPPGMVVPFNKPCPPGWIDANGFSGTPNLQGRKVIGANGAFGGLGTIGGNPNGKYQLKVENLPHHRHGNLYNDGGHGDHTNMEQDPDFESDDTKHTDDCPDCKDEEFSIMDPYYVLQYCVRFRVQTP